MILKYYQKTNSSLIYQYVILYGNKQYDVVCKQPE